MTADLILKNVRFADRRGLCDVAIKSGLIVDIAQRIDAISGHSEDLQGALLIPGFVDSHCHLDKAHILDRCPICEGTLSEAVRLSAAAKAQFSVEDIYARAERVVRSAISHGTQSMRSFVEVDPRVGLRGLEALTQLKRDYAWGIDLQLSAFAQEGLSQEMQTYALLETALKGGADLIGGCPYTDPDPQRHIALIFDLAQRHDVDVDFHLDFSLTPRLSHIADVIEQTEARGYGGRVSIGHVSTLSALTAADFSVMAQKLSAAGIALTVLPATDLFLNGRDYEALVPRGVTPAHRLHDVTVSLASNNIMNPFTPYGDASLVRMANLYANVTQAASDPELDRIATMISSQAARVMGRPYGLHIGKTADCIAIDASDMRYCLREIILPFKGWKNGRPSFIRPQAELLYP